MSTSYKLPEEWFKQADYDLGTAKAMLRTRRYIYTVFMCHLAIVPTRYPDELQRLLQDFKKSVTKKTYNQTEELLQWLKKVDL